MTDIAALIADFDNTSSKTPNVFNTNLTSKEKKIQEKINSITADNITDMLKRLKQNKILVKVLPILQQEHHRLREKFDKAKPETILYKMNRTLKTLQQDARLKENIRSFISDMASAPTARASKHIGKASGLPARASAPTARPTTASKRTSRASGLPARASAPTARASTASKRTSRASGLPARASALTVNARKRTAKARNSKSPKGGDGEELVPIFIMLGLLQQVLEHGINQHQHLILLLEIHNGV